MGELLRVLSLHSVEGDGEAHQTDCWRLLARECGRGDAKFGGHRRAQRKRAPDTGAETGTADPRADLRADDPLRRASDLLRSGGTLVISKLEVRRLNDVDTSESAPAH
eukprot:scaffold43350_cov29-Tisochrysis_lutea.AAC.1